MRTWTRKHAKFVGRVIFANFLKLPLERYKNIIEEVEGSTLFKKWNTTSKALLQIKAHKLKDQGNEDIDSARIKRPLTDNQIRAKLESEYRVKLSRYSIALCRKDMGIPPAKRRFSGYKYPPLSVDFSLLYPLAVESDSLQGKSRLCLS